MSNWRTRHIQSAAPRPRHLIRTRPAPTGGRRRCTSVARGTHTLLMAKARPPSVVPNQWSERENPVPVTTMRVPASPSGGVKLPMRSAGAGGAARLTGAYHAARVVCHTRYAGSGGCYRRVGWQRHCRWPGQRTRARLRWRDARPCRPKLPDASTDALRAQRMTSGHLTHMRRTVKRLTRCVRTSKVINQWVVFVNRIRAAVYEQLRDEKWIARYADEGRSARTVTHKPHSPHAQAVAPSNGYACEMARRAQWSGSPHSCHSASGR